jgi:hypothetical protein
MASAKVGVGIFARSSSSKKSKSSLQYFSMTSCNSVTVVAGFLVSLDEQGPDLMFGVRALS